MERLVNLEHLVTRVHVDKRVPEGSRVLMEKMAHKDRAEDLAREVPWETVDHLEHRVLQERMAQTVNEDLAVILDLKESKEFVDSRERREIRVHVV